ncbi:TPA: hypothetical protein R1R37_005215 [Klebsiella aerogenes]|nr:hypothetical protein [Klebsiella aerogenes]
MKHTQTNNNIRVSLILKNVIKVFKYTTKPTSIPKPEASNVPYFFCEFKIGIYVPIKSSNLLTPISRETAVYKIAKTAIINIVFRRNVTLEKTPVSKNTHAQNDICGLNITPKKTKNKKVKLYM